MYIMVVSKLDFGEIMQACKASYKPFEGTVEMTRKPASLVDSIAAAKKDGRRPVIAEIKPASPTAGAIRTVGDPAEIAKEYAGAGACGVSVLTEPKYFGGSLANLQSAAGISVPVLRKDFLFDLSQVKESYYYGADTLLLISSFFSADSLAAMIAECRRYGMEPLVEVHDRDDVERSASAGATLYAVNNRDRHTLKVDLRRTRDLAPAIDGTVVSASGVSTVDQLKFVLSYSDAALVGTALMRAERPGSALQNLIW
ncbi:indole-3-glycerol phosphate synthase [Methanocella arvoryzae MRE50]|uniref:Indole-3-glycerol phosphate synthase n=2 Tax=Methanocella TaxID=570266 RepID=Q0W625_METAR|nr:indole-3-glycerol phosphate synthase [Methanocella arvoryzae MRE50]